MVVRCHSFDRVGESSSLALHLAEDRGVEARLVGGAPLAIAYPRFFVSGNLTMNSDYEPIFAEKPDYYTDFG